MGLSQYQADLVDKVSSVFARHKIGRKLQRETTQVAVYEYDFAKDGGAVGAKTLRSLDGLQIPDNAIIVRGVVDVLTTLTTASADAGTIALHVKTANDIKAAVAVSHESNVWDAGIQAVVPTGAANAVKTTAKSDVIATVAIQAVTAGKFLVFLEYYVSE